MEQVFRAIQSSNVDVGARTIEVNRAEYVVRGLGGVMYLAGALIMCVNLWQTVRGRIRGAEPLAVAAE